MLFSIRFFPDHSPHIQYVEMALWPWIQTMFGKKPDMETVLKGNNTLSFSILIKKNKRPKNSVSYPLLSNYVTNTEAKFSLNNL